MCFGLRCSIRGQRLGTSPLGSQAIGEDWIGDFLADFTGVRTHTGSLAKFGGQISWLIGFVVRRLMAGVVPAKAVPVTAVMVGQ